MEALASALVNQSMEWVSLLFFAFLPALLGILFRLAGDAGASRYCLWAALGSLLVIVCSQVSSELALLLPVRNTLRLFVSRAGKPIEWIWDYPITASAVAGFAAGIVWAHLTCGRQKALARVR